MCGFYQAHHESRNKEILKVRVPSHQAAAITKCKKLRWEWGCQILKEDLKCHHWKVKMKSPTSLFLIFLAKMWFSPFWVELIRKWAMEFSGLADLNPLYLQTYGSNLNSEKCILIIIEFPLIWYVIGLRRSKFDPVFKGLKEWEVLSLLRGEGKTRSDKRQTYVWWAITWPLVDGFRNKWHFWNPWIKDFHRYFMVQTRVVVILRKNMRSKKGNCECDSFFPLPLRCKIFLIVIAKFFWGFLRKFIQGFQKCHSFRSPSTGGRVMPHQT